jgi:hypothetical protein
VKCALHITVNGVASALRNSGWAFWIMKLKEMAAEGAAAGRLAILPGPHAGDGAEIKTHVRLFVIGLHINVSVLRQPKVSKLGGRLPSVRNVIPTADRLIFLRPV